MGDGIAGEHGRHKLGWAEHHRELFQDLRVCCVEGRPYEITA